ncbi:hypothetical protein [Nostoc sp. C052]|nr:hypothetical protein [Nostoc sp. C052]
MQTEQALKTNEILAIVGITNYEFCLAVLASVVNKKLCIEQV